MTYIMKMREERAEAYDEGRQQGESAKLLRTVLRQLQRHADYKDIASDNEISVEQVAQIAKENHLAY